MAISEDDFKDCLRRIGKEDADVNFIRRFREMMEELYPDGEVLSKGRLFKARIVAYVGESDHLYKPKELPP